MADHEVRGDRAVYDIEIEDPRETRRRRPAADWGVSEEIFDRMPSPRRRFRPSENPPARRESHPRRFEPVRDEAHVGRAEAQDEAREAREVRAARRRDLEAVRAAAAREAAAREDALMLEPTPAAIALDEPRELAPRAERRDEMHQDGSAHGGVPGRRTVVINGQASLARRRPAPTVPERIGPRPDRLAAYAVALGVLLIVIALLSQ
jgi:hypothetical protein